MLIQWMIWWILSRCCITLIHYHCKLWYEHCVTLQDQRHIQMLFRHTIFLNFVRRWWNLRVWKIREWYLCLLKSFLSLIFIDYFTQFLHIIIRMGRNAITFLGRIFWHQKPFKQYQNTSRCNTEDNIKLTFC